MVGTAGNILVFNNGQQRPAGSYSTVDEIVPHMTDPGVYSLSPGQSYGPLLPVWYYEALPTTAFYGQSYQNSFGTPVFKATKYPYG